mmetsp:Transcript_17053/g.17734  ORF Transcript_17053/g.17734 Transcript_17053/m.17734 type:complete len:95 (+) Transcript_17053:13-297(+)
MGRKPRHIVFITFGMIVGSIAGLKLADLFLWNDDLKYRIWEETETKFWEEHGKPVNLEAIVKFDSVINQGTVFYSYLPPLGSYIEGDYFTKYEI